MTSGHTAANHRLHETVREAQLAVWEASAAKAAAQARSEAASSASAPRSVYTTHPMALDHTRTWEDGHYRIPLDLVRRDPSQIPSRSKAAAAAAAADNTRNIHYVPSPVPKIHEMLA